VEKSDHVVTSKSELPWSTVPAKCPRRVQEKGRWVEQLVFWRVLTAAPELAEHQFAHGFERIEYANARARNGLIVRHRHRIN